MTFRPAHLARSIALMLTILIGFWIVSSIWEGRLVAETAQCDLGLMSLGVESMGDVRLRNTGWKAITIVECTATCGCSRLELSNHRVAPGETVVVRAIVYPNSTSRVGEISAIQIKTDSPRQPGIRIPIVTAGLAGLRLIPDSIDFGSIPIEQLPRKVKAKMIVNSQRAIPVLHRFQCRIDDPRLTASVVASEGGGAEVVVEMTDQCLPGDYWTHLTVLEPGGPLRATIPIHARVLGPYHTDPGIVVLDAGSIADANKGRRVKVSRRNNGTNDFLSITAISVPEVLQKLVTAEVESPSVVVLKAVATVETGAFRSRIQNSVSLQVHDDELGDSLVTVPIAITLRPRHDISAIAQ